MQSDRQSVRRRLLWPVVAATALALLALAVVAVWAPDRSVETLSARWAPAPSRFITVGRLRAHLRDEGPRDDSVPVVLLHGTSASLHTWEGWATALRTDHRVIRMDLPGFGLTGPTADNDYSIESYVRFTLALLDSLGVKRFNIAGNSLGGEIAWHVTAAAPERVQHMVLVDAAGFPMSSTSMPIGFRMARTQSLAWLMTRILPKAVVAWSVKSVYGNPALVSDSLIDRYFELTLRAGNRASLPQRFAQSKPGADTALLRGLKVPTLILWGAKDGLIPPDHATRFARDIAGSRMILYDGVGHVPQEEAPAKTVADVRAFLAPSVTANR